MWIKRLAIAMLFVANSAIAAPSIISPAPGSSLPPGEVYFRWEPDGIEITRWEVMAGSSPGASDYYSSGSKSNDDIAGTNITPYVYLKGLPQDESTVYITVNLSAYDTLLQTLTAEYTAAERVPVLKPIDVAFLYGPTVFSWDPNGLDLADTRVRLIYDGPLLLFGPGQLTPRLGPATNSGIMQLPATGDNLIVRLWYRLEGVSQWRYVDRTYFLWD